MAQEGNRRGFITSGAGVGVFVAAAMAPGAASAAPIGSADVLVAMPGERFYAIPKPDLERFAVNASVFAEEEARRATSAAVSKGSPRRPAPTPMGVRG
jgi:hypothetical protein